jgi:hypothetical protein
MMMNTKDAQIRRLQIALRGMLQANPSMPTIVQSTAFLNAAKVLECLPSVGFQPEIEGSNIDEPSGDVYIDGIWQPELIAILEASCVLRKDQPNRKFRPCTYCGVNSDNHHYWYNLDTKEDIWVCTSQECNEELPENVCPF